MNEQLKIVTKDLHPEAEALARQYINNFAASLLLHAKILAYRRRDNVVLENHIKEAFDTVGERRDRTWSRELMMLFGAAFFGAFVQGFVPEISKGQISEAAIYAGIGVFGMILAFRGLRSR